MRRGPIGGFWRSFMVGLGSLVGDSFWAVVALTGAAFIVGNGASPHNPRRRRGLWLLRLAFGALRAAIRDGLPEAAPRFERGRDFAVGAVASLANPYIAGFWLAVGGGVSVSLVRHRERLGLVVFFAGFLLGAVTWSAVVSSLVAVAHRRGTRRFMRVANIIAVGVLGYFCAILFWRAGTG